MKGYNNNNNNNEGWADVFCLISNSPGASWAGIKSGFHPPEVHVLFGAGSAPHLGSCRPQQSSRAGHKPAFSSGERKWDDRSPQKCWCLQQGRGRQWASSRVTSVKVICSLTQTCFQKSHWDPSDFLKLTGIMDLPHIPSTHWLHCMVCLTQANRKLCEKHILRHTLFVLVLQQN